MNIAAFHVSSGMVLTERGTEHWRVVQAVTIRHVVCGEESAPFGLNGDAVLLAELNKWAEQHTCPGLTVN